MSELGSKRLSKARSKAGSEFKLPHHHPYPVEKAKKAGKAKAKASLDRAAGVISQKKHDGIVKRADKVLGNGRSDEPKARTESYPLHVTKKKAQRARHDVERGNLPKTRSRTFAVSAQHMLGKKKVTRKVSAHTPGEAMHFAQRHFAEEIQRRLLCDRCRQEREKETMTWLRRVGA